jgi:DNA-binding response OmpR family regulator
MSGYTGDELGERGVIEANVNLLPKPFRPSELVERVHALLRTAATADESDEDQPDVA